MNFVERKEKYWKSVFKYVGVQDVFEKIKYQLDKEQSDKIQFKGNGGWEIRPGGRDVEKENLEAAIKVFIEGGVLAPHIPDRGIFLIDPEKFKEISSFLMPPNQS